MDSEIPSTTPWSLCFFNNKGGVGKTTLACNVSSYLARHERLKVLVVDADPQCNASQLILPTEYAAEIYDGSKQGGSARSKTLKDVLAPLGAGEAKISIPDRVVSSADNRFAVDLLPGHPKTALLEDKLSQNWGSFIGGDIGGARISNWNTQLLSSLGNRYDLIVYDIGPSLGALNRTVLIGVDYFMAPMGCDIFSLIGIDNIADWLQDWRELYKQSIAQCDRRHPKEIDQYQVKSHSKMCEFVGYTVQQYITKTIRSERRATGAYENILNEIPKRIEEKMAPLIASGLQARDLQLSNVPHMFSLVPLAQTARAPIDLLTSSDGLSGGQYAQQLDYKSFIARLSQSLLANLRRTKGVSAP